MMGAALIAATSVDGSVAALIYLSDGYTLIPCQ